MGGLGQTVSRMIEVDRRRVRALVSYALLLGALSGSILLFSAPLWAWLWGTAESVEPIRWLAISSSLSPLLGLATGLMARLGKFRGLALITLGSNVAGMLVGAAAVTAWQSASSLIVSAAVAQVLTLIGAVAATDGCLLGVANFRNARADIGYSGKLASTSMLSYMTGNIVKFSMVRGIDAASLGHWNRAEVLTSIPMQQMQSALIRAVYPQFRHDIDESARARTVWTDMLILVSWVALTISAIAFVLVPPIVPLLFGAGWELAAALAGPLAIVGGLQIVSTLLASAVEALGKFRWLLWTEIVLIVIQMISAFAIVVFHDIMMAVTALVITNVVRHGLHVLLLGRDGYLDVARLLRHYGLAIGGASILGLTCWIAVQFVLLQGLSVISLVVVVLVISIPAFCFFRMRNRLPPVVIARRYRLLSKAE